MTAMTRDEFNALPDRERIEKLEQMLIDQYCNLVAQPKSCGHAFFCVCAGDEINALMGDQLDRFVPQASSTPT